MGSVVCMREPPQCKAESRALHGRWLNPDAPAVLFHDFSDQRQARARPAAKLLAPVESFEHLENSAVVLRCNPDAVVPDIHRWPSVAVRLHLTKFDPRVLAL